MSALLAAVEREVADYEYLSRWATALGCPHTAAAAAELAEKARDEAKKMRGML